MTSESPIVCKVRALNRHKHSSLAMARACAEAVSRASGVESQRLAATARRMHLCASTFSVTPLTLPGDATRLLIRHPWDCKSPLCQLSARRKASIARKKTEAIIRIAEGLQSAPLVFLTLTAKNRPWHQLPAMLDDLADAERRFLDLAAVRRAFTGAISAHEVVCRGTLGAPEAGAHAHLLVQCHPDYFDRMAEQPRYLSQAAITTLFQRCLRASYKPIVHIQRVRAADASTGRESIANAVRELNKYVIKPAELFKRGTFGLQADPEIVRVLAGALYRRKMLRMTGIFAQASRIYTQRKEAANN